jgi:ribosomal protein S18 acetylase RimI-like enzyme
MRHEEHPAPVIREAAAEDAARLDALLTALIREEARYDPNLNPGCTVTDNYADRIGREDHRLFLAEAEGTAVGFLYGFVYRVPGVWLRPAAILDALYVEAPYRRRGCGRALCQAFLAFAREAGACRVELKVLSENAGALALYRSLSFRERKKQMDLPLSGA